MGVKLARRLKMLLAGFVRGETLTIYSGRLAEE
jgi:formate dehydrogenase assembly factor FdhD